MKKTLTLFLLFMVLMLSAQEKAEIKNFFWGQSDEYKNANTTPDKWKKESAVIINKFLFYDYHKFGKSVTYTAAIRKRIKLLDAVAVKEFSEFSFKDKFYSDRGFSLKKGTNTIGVKIVKPSGKEIEIDVEKEAKKVDEETKLAIANLEVGDIIDYYYYSIEPFKSTYQFGFDPEERTLGDVYPIMNFKLNFQTENDFFVNFSSYNGAPDLKEIATNKGGERKYELIAKDLEKNDFPRWFDPLVELPCFKFQVYFARSGKFESLANAFLSQKERDVKKTVSKEDILDYYYDKFRPTGELEYINKFLKDKTYASDEEKVREVYYFTRHKYFTQYIEASVVRESGFMYFPFDLYDNPIFFNTEEAFINHFMGFLKKNKIDYDIIIATNRYNGSIEDLLIQRNVSVLLRVNTPTPIYLEYFTPFSSADQFNYYLENTKAFALQVSRGRRVVDAENAALPSSTAKDNLSKIVTSFSFSEDLVSLMIKRESSFFGHFKDSQQRGKLNFYDYVYEDYSKYDTKPFIDRIKSKKERAQVDSKYQALISSMKEKQKEELKKNVSEEFGFLIEDVSFKVKNTGRFGKNVPFVYEEEFTIKDQLVKKAGQNFLVDIGMLITSQVEIEKSELNRKNNVYTGFPKSFENEIVFDIPTGYSVSGLEKLNKNIENSAGKFISTANLNGNKIVIKTLKEYSNYFEPNKNWEKMVQFLDAAYQFTQEKILLKKI